MTVALCSIFRNSERYLPRYFGQIDMLREEVKDLRLVLTEGDSSDNTWHALMQLGMERPGSLMQRQDHGGPDFGSVDNEQRWQQIASVVRPTIAAALELDPDVVVWVESDLMWQTEHMVKLIAWAREGHTVCPMNLAWESERFYDTWGYRKGGKSFLSYPPYLPNEPQKDLREPLIPIDSCGSCFATPDMKSLAEWDGHWPYRGGGKLKLDQSLLVEHP